MQQEDQSGELQIILQEVISIINNLIKEKMIGDDKRWEEIIGDNGKWEETLEDNDH